MKNSLIRVLTVCLFILTVTLFANQVLAQGKGGKKGGGGNDGGGEDPPTSSSVQYEVVWGQIPDGYRDINIRDFQIADDGLGNSIATAVGFLQDDSPDQRYTACVFTYDQSTGVSTWETLEDLIGGSMPAWVPTNLTESVFYGINSSGTAVGVFLNSDLSERVHFYINLPDASPVPQQIPPPTLPGPYRAGYRNSVNELGEIAVRYESTDPNTPFNKAAVFNPQTQTLHEVPFDVEGDIYFNSLGQVLATRAVDQMVVRYTIGMGTEEFPDLATPTGINDFGQFVANSSGLPKKKGATAGTVRVELNGSVEWYKHTSDLPGISFSGLSWGLNGSGDVFCGAENKWQFNEGDPNVQDDSDEVFVYNLESVIVNSSDPDDSTLSLFDSTYWIYHLSGRDITGYGWMAGTSSIEFTDGTRKKRLVLFVPQLSP